MRRALNTLRWPADRMHMPSAMTAASVTVDPTNSSAQLQLRSDGSIHGTNGTNTVVDRGKWLNRGQNAGNYECFATLVSGTLSSGTTGSWLALSTQRSWVKTDTVADDIAVTAEIDIDIRTIGTTQILSTARITLSANKNSIL